MTIIVVDPDPKDPTVPWLDADGQPVSTSQLPDGTPIKQVAGWLMALTQEELDQRQADADAYAARVARSKDQRIDEDILANASFIRDPLFRAIIKVIVAALGMTIAQFRDAVKAELLNDPET